MTTTDTDSPAPAKRMRRSRAKPVDRVPEIAAIEATYLAILPLKGDTAAIERVVKYAKDMLGAE